MSSINTVSGNGNKNYVSGLAAGETYYGFHGGTTNE